MSDKLPSRAHPIILTAGLLILAASTQIHRSQAPAAGDNSPPNGPADRRAESQVTGQVMLEEAILRLERHRSVSAKIHQKGSLFGQEPIGTGTYLQQRANNKLLFRLELTIHIGDEESSLVHVSDNNGHLWLYQELPGQDPTLTRIDVKRIEEVLGA